MEICQNPDCGKEYDPQVAHAKGIVPGACSLYCSAFVEPADHHG